MNYAIFATNNDTNILTYVTATHSREEADSYVAAGYLSYEGGDFPWWDAVINKRLTVSQLFSHEENFSAMFWFISYLDTNSVSENEGFDPIVHDDDSRRGFPPGADLYKEDENGEWYRWTDYYFTPQDKKRLNKMLSDFLTANLFRPEF